MTDITPIQPSGTPGKPDHVKGPQPGGPAAGGSFAKFLEEAGRADRPGAAAPAGPGMPVSPTPYIGPIHPDPAIPGAVLNLGRQFLELAEEYQDRLADPKATLRDIAPLIKDLEAHRDRLSEQLDRLPAEDPARGLLEEMAALLSSESVKFNRGDYI